MSDIILIPLMTFVGFVAGAAWMYRIVNRAIDEYGADQQGKAGGMSGATETYGSTHPTTTDTVAR